MMWNCDFVFVSEVSKGANIANASIGFVSGIFGSIKLMQGPV